MFILLSLSPSNVERHDYCYDVIRLRRPTLCSTFDRQDFAMARDKVCESMYHPKLDK